MIRLLRRFGKNKPTCEIVKKEKNQYKFAEYIHICFITICSCNCSVLLCYVNLLLYLTYKLNFIIGMNIYEKTYYIQGSVLLSFGFRHPLKLWGLGNYPSGDKGGGLLHSCFLVADQDLFQRLNPYFFSNLGLMQKAASSFPKIDLT